MNLMILKMRNFVLILFALLMCITACQEADKKPVSEDINIWIKRDPAKLNPMTYPSSTARGVYQYIMVPLADFHPETLELYPILIKDLPTITNIEDGPYRGGLSFKFELRDEAVWDDGKPITGYDYLFTIKAIKNPLVQAGSWRSFVEDLSQVIVDPENPKLFEVIYKEPYVLALEAVSTVNLYPAHIYDAEGAMEKYSLEDFHSAEAAAVLEKDSTAMKFSDEMNAPKFSRDIVRGAGPYKLSQWETGQYLVLTKQDNYWGEAFKDNPFLQGNAKRLVFKIVKDENAAVGLLKSGNLHVAGEISSAIFEDLKNDELVNKQFSFFNPQLIRQYYVQLNHTDKILKDLNVRKALALVTDVPQMIANFENGLGTRQLGAFHNTKSYYHKGLKNIPYDLEEAKKILDQAAWLDSDNDGIRDKVVNGKKEDLEVEILISKRELGRKVSLMLQESAQKVGIRIKLESQANATINQRKKSGAYQMVASAITQEAAPDDPYNRWHTEGSNNLSNYSNTEADLLIDKIRNTIDAPARHKLYLRLQEIMYQDAAAIFLYSPKERIVCSSTLNARGSSKRPGYMANTFSFK